MTVIVLFCYLLVEYNARGKVFGDMHQISPAEYALVLGTTPQNRFNGGTNYFFVYRMDAAQALYQEGKVKWIVVSGDECSLNGINEPQCMKDSLIARGVPADRILMDGKGYSTVESIQRMQEVFGASDYVIVSQEFHNERAVFLAEHLGLDVDRVQALNARSPRSRRAMITYAREYLARVKMMVDILRYRRSN